MESHSDGPLGRKTHVKQIDTGALIKQRPGPGSTTERRILLTTDELVAHGNTLTNAVNKARRVQRWTQATEKRRAARNAERGQKQRCSVCSREIPQGMRGFCVGDPWNGHEPTPVG